MYHTLSIMFLRLFAIYMSLDMFLDIANNLVYAFQHGYKYYFVIIILWNLITICFAIAVWFFAPKISTYVLKNQPEQPNQKIIPYNDVISICSTIIICGGFIILGLSFKYFTPLITELVLYDISDPAFKARDIYVVLPYTLLAGLMIFFPHKILNTFDIIKHKNTNDLGN